MRLALGQSRRNQLLQSLPDGRARHAIFFGQRPFVQTRSRLEDTDKNIVRYVSAQNVGKGIAGLDLKH